MIIQTSNYSSTNVSMEVIDDYNRCLFRCYFTKGQLDQFIGTLTQHRANMAAANYQHYSDGSNQHREAGPHQPCADPSGNSGWDGGSVGGYGGGGCGNGL